MSSKDADRPRSLKCEEVRRKREKLLSKERRVQELTKFVNEMRETTGHGKNVPYFDPLDGGVEAQCLFLFEAAGGKAVESGFVSRNNDDASAEKFFQLNDEEGFDRRYTISWNIVPWALRETGKNRPPTSEEIEQGKEWLEKLIEKLDYLKVVVLCGNKAQRATEFFYTEHEDLCILHAPHPSPQSMNQHGKKAHLHVAIRKASQKLKS